MGAKRRFGIEGDAPAETHEVETPLGHVAVVAAAETHVDVAAHHPHPDMYVHDAQPAYV